LFVWLFGFLVGWLVGWLVLMISIVILCNTPISPDLQKKNQRFKEILNYRETGQEKKRPG